MTSHFATRPQAQPRKRGKIVPAMLCGALVFTLSACQNEEESVEAVSFPDAASCRNAANNDTIWWLAEECNAAYRQAQQAHQREAPIYDSRALCQEQHEGICEERRDSRGALVFAPAMAGFLMGNVWKPGSQGFASRPLYASREEKDTLVTPQGEKVMKDVGKIVNKTIDAFREHQAKTAPKTITRASLQARGGFGSSKTSSFSFGG